MRQPSINPNRSLWEQAREYLGLPKLPKLGLLLWDEAEYEQWMAVIAKARRKGAKGIIWWKGGGRL